MTAVDSDRVKRIFQEARELPRRERLPFLESACSAETALRARVDSLLAAFNEAGGFLSRPERRCPDHGPLR